MSNATAKTRGVKIVMGDKLIHFLPLNWASLEVLQEDLDKVSSFGAGERNQVFFTKDERECILRVVSHQIIAANDGVDEQWVKNNLDLANIGEVLESVFTVNGYSDAGEPQDGGEGAGEQKAAD